MAGGFPDIYGAPIGQSAYLQDLAAQAQTQHMQALTQGQQVQNAQQAANLQNQQRMQALMQHFGVQGGTSEDKIERMGNMFVDAGLVDQGAKLLDTAAQIRDRKQMAGQRAAQEQRLRSEQQMKHLSFVNDLVQGVKDQATLDLALQQYHKVDPNPTELDGMTYEQAKPLLQYLQTNTPEALKRMKFQANMQVKGAQLDNIASEIEARSVRRMQEEKKIAEKERHDQVLEKASGSKGHIGPPSEREMEGASSALSKSFPNMDSGSRDQAAPLIAWDAKKLMRGSNNSLPWEDALQQAIANRQLNGDFKDEVKEPSAFGMMFGQVFSTKKSFVGSGRIPQSAVQLPIDRSGRIQADKLVANHYYYTAKGLAQYDGKGGFNLVPGGR